ncbi:VCBS repeat-containing protein [Christiangramia aquimixticola]|uniref:VCBS repeat-containing protein n=1 Tax=Christiangramia aquimixticola TaxID=1697558 RepID=UPI003AA9D26C
MIKAIRLTYLQVLILLLSACDHEPDTLFVQHHSNTTNIDFSNQLDEDSNLNILNYLYYYNGAGVAAADYNQDGLTDLYFTSNEGEDKMYLNQGDFKFKEIIGSAGIHNKTGWTTGVSNVDINNDGLMDLYVSKVSGILGLEGHNLLFVNKGVDASGIPQFQESAERYGLDFSGFSTQSVFLDYDQDGDLDMFLLNHSIHPNKNYGNGNKRKSFDPKAGDRLFRNEDGKFIDVSKGTGIFQGIIGYGLGVGVGDFNNDGYPDIFVGNDFFENDYLYINQQDGSFKDLITTNPESLGHTTHYSMGNDIADFNNDGFTDIVSLDMLPADLKTYKTSGLEFPFQTYSNFLRNGFSPQYMQNTLHENRGDLIFSETAFLKGIAATEWSWSPLFADFDNDGLKDLFISNGIKGATNDMDYIKFISNDKIQAQLSKGEDVDLTNLTRELPEKKVKNFIYRNSGVQGFEDKSNTWLNDEAGFSHGSIYVDLDNDGDLDLVVNNTDAPAGIFENTLNKEKKTSNYLKVLLKGPEKNRFGIGAKVTVFKDGELQMQEHYLSRGYLSSLAPGLHFGLGNYKKVDSVQINWGNKKYTTVKNIKASSILEVEYDGKTSNIANKPSGTKALLKVENFDISYTHTEQSTLDFNRQILAPFAYSNLGPRLCVGDLNADGLEDLVFGGGKSQPLQVWYQSKSGTFITNTDQIFEKDAISENTSQLLLDVEQDGDLDLLVVSGGNEFKQGPALQPKLYLNTVDGFILDSLNFKNVSLNASNVSKVDFNKDGYPDIFIAANIVPGEVGKDPVSYLFKNNGKGNFTDVTADLFKDSLGMVQDVKWTDYNADGYEDLVVTGHWISPQIYLNIIGQEFKKLVSNLDDNSGWWNSLEISDFDNDGDLDVIAGNWGFNTRLTATSQEPINLYLNDFDDNGTEEPVISYFYKGEETVFSSKDELDQQMPGLKKKFNTYKAFANAEFSEIFPKDKLEKSLRKKVTELASCYFENLGNGEFKKHVLPMEAQASAIFAIQKYDFNGDGFEDILLAGNNYEISTQLGRLDASHGSLLLNDGKGSFYPSQDLPNIQGPARDIKKICINNQQHFIVTFNNGKPLLLKSNK